MPPLLALVTPPESDLGAEDTDEGCERWTAEFDQEYKRHGSLGDGTIIFIIHIGFNVAGPDWNVSKASKGKLGHLAYNI
jgi:hypothetical protein